MMDGSYGQDLAITTGGLSSRTTRSCFRQRQIRSQRHQTVFFSSFRSGRRITPDQKRRRDAANRRPTETRHYERRGRRGRGKGGQTKQRTLPPQPLWIRRQEKQRVYVYQHTQAQISRHQQFLLPLASPTASIWLPLMSNNKKDFFLMSSSPVWTN